MIAALDLPWRLARRELRGGLKGFRVFLACLTLGVTAIAGIGSMSESILAGLRADARTLLGGDVDLRLTHRRATPEQRDWLVANTERLSAMAEMRAMARTGNGGARSLVELKAVDNVYPLFGGFHLESGASLSERLAVQGNAWGAVAERRLLQKLSIRVGDRVRVGEAVVVITDVIAKEPDRGTRAFNLGPRLMIGFPALQATGLVLPGSLIRYHYRLDAPDNASHRAWIVRLNERFPDAGWRIRSIDNAAPNIQRFVDRVTLFLSLVGLTALLVGGVGVSNAVRSYLDSRTNTIAILKCLGSPGATIFRTYLLQVLVLATIGIALGIFLGAILPVFVTPLLAERLPIAAQAGLYPWPLILAVAFGYLITIVFSIGPLGMARDVTAANLFRAAAAPPSKRPRAVYLIGMIGAILLLAGLTIAAAHMPKFAAWFVIGAIATFAIFHGAARLIMAALRRLPRPRNAVLRLALTNISRPGATTASVVLSLGLGLTVLVAVALIEGNLSRQINETIPEEAPGFYFIDIQPRQVAEFNALLGEFPGVTDVQTVPMLRGRLMKLNGTSVKTIKPPPELAWILRGDRGLTWSRRPPVHGSRMVAGEWWPTDYKGPPLVSFDARAAAGFGLEVGDTLTVNVLGREVTARIANLREIDWTTLSINFVMIFSPGLLEGAPQANIATAKTDPTTELTLERTVTDRFPNVSAIRVKEIMEGIADILDRLGTAVRAIAAIAVLAGALVLAGAIAATHRRRVHDAVLLKVLGATRRDILATYLVEFGLLGVVTSVVAAIIGSVAAWAVIEFVMRASWTFIPWAVATTALLCLCITLAFGFVGTWRALGHKAAPVLRNE